MWLFFDVTLHPFFKKDLNHSVSILHYNEVCIITLHNLLTSLTLSCKIAPHHLQTA